MTGGGAAALLGLGTAVEEEELVHSEGLIAFAQLGLSSNREERKEFDRLVRSGIPLVYRSKVWLECSGGLDMKEPGLFTDLLAKSDSEGGVVREIEKDVGRTMPLNIFFGRTGAGVDKLRRVLTAYSRWVVFVQLYLNSAEYVQAKYSCWVLSRNEPRHIYAPSGSCRRRRGILGPCRYHRTAAA